MGKAARYVGRKIQAEHAADAVGSEGYACKRCRLRQALRELRGARAQRLEKPRGLDQAQRGQSGGHRDGIAGQRAGLVDGAQRRQMRHDIAPAAEGRGRHAAAYHLAQAGQVGADAVQRLGAAQRDAKAAHHFVEDQDRAVAGAQFAHRLQELGRRADQIHIAGNWLDDHRGDFVAQCGEGFRERVDVVVFQYRGELRDLGRHARRGRIAEGQQA